VQTARAADVPEAAAPGAAAPAAAGGGGGTTTTRSSAPEEPSGTLATDEALAALREKLAGGK